MSKGLNDKDKIGGLTMLAIIVGSVAFGMTFFPLVTMFIIGFIVFCIWLLFQLL